MRRRSGPAPLTATQKALVRRLRQQNAMREGDGLSVPAMRALRLGPGPRPYLSWFTVAALLEHGLVSVQPGSHLVKLTPKGWRLPL